MISAAIYFLCALYVATAVGFLITTHTRRRQGTRREPSPLRLCGLLNPRFLQ